MSAFALVLAVYATQVVAGLCVVGLVRPVELRPGERFARALLFGPAALAVQMFAYHHLGLPFRLELVLPPWWFGLLLLRRRAFGASTGSRGPPGRRLVAAFAAVLFGASLVQGLLVPLYWGDGLENFAVVARVFETEGSLAPAELLNEIDARHVEYPPLLASNEALLFLAAGDARSLAIEPFFALAGLALWLLVIELAYRRLPPRWAAPVATLFVAWPVGYLHATWGFADLRLTGALLLVIVEAERMLERGNFGSAISAALALGACAWTKNEGIALAVLALPVLAYLMRRAGAGRAAIAFAVLLVGVLTAAWPLFRIAHGIEDAYWSGAASSSAFGRLARVGAVLARFRGLPFARDTAGHLEWGCLWPVGALLVAVGLALSRRRRRIAFALALLGAQVLVYTVALALTPQPFEWHLDTAAARLWMHTQPLFLLTVCAACRSIAGEPEVGVVGTPAPAPRLYAGGGRPLPLE